MLVALVVVCFAVLAMAWRIWSRAAPVADSMRPNLVRLQKELSRLDPWSFHLLPGRDFGADHVVPRSLVARELAERTRTAQPHQVQRVAETLPRRAAR